MEQELERVEIDNENTNYLEALAKAKNDIDQLNKQNKKLKADNKQIVESMMNGELLEQATVTNNRTDKEIAEEYFDETLSNREKIRLALEYRNKVIEEKGPSADPFVNQSEFSKPTQADYLEASHVAEGLQAILDNSETDEEFIMEYNRAVR